MLDRLLTMNLNTGKVKASSAETGDKSLKLQPLKIQVPLFTSPGLPLVCLIYNQSRDVQYQLPYDETLRKFMDDRPKAYVMGHLVPNTLPGKEGTYVFKIEKDLGPLWW